MEKVILILTLSLAACTPAIQEAPITETPTPALSKQLKDELQQIQAAAQAGDARAQTTLGTLYKEGGGVSQDYDKAREWYEKAAAQNHATAQYLLGLLYAQGRGIERDDSKAREWWEKAAKQGFPPAQTGMGLLYTYGKNGVPHDDDKQREWLEKSAAQNFAPAEKMLKELDAISKAYGNK